MYRCRNAISINGVNGEAGRSCLIDDDEENEAIWNRNRCKHNELNNGKTGVNHDGDNTNRKKNKTKWVQVPFTNLRPSLYDLHSQPSGANFPVNVWKNKKGSELFVKKEVVNELVTTKKSSSDKVDCTTDVPRDECRNEISEEQMLIEALEESIKTHEKEEQERHRALLIEIANLSEDEMLGGSDSNSKRDNTVSKWQKKKVKGKKMKDKKNNGHDRNNNVDSKKNNDSTKDYVVGYRLVRDKDIDFKDRRDGTDAVDETLRFVTMTFNNSNAKNYNKNNEREEVMNCNTTASCSRKKKGKSRNQKNEPVKCSGKLKSSCKLEIKTDICQSKTDSGIEIASSGCENVEIKENINLSNFEEGAISSSHMPQPCVNSLKIKPRLESVPAKLSSKEDVSNDVIKEKTIGILKNVTFSPNVERSKPFSDNVTFINKECLHPNTVDYNINNLATTDNFSNLSPYTTCCALSSVSESSASPVSVSTSISDTSDNSSIKSVWSTSESPSDLNIGNNVDTYPNCGQNVFESNSDGLNYTKICSDMPPSSMNTNNQSFVNNSNLCEPSINLNEGQTSSIVNSLRNTISEIIKTNDNDVIDYIMSQILKDNFNKLTVNRNTRTISPEIVHAPPGFCPELKDQSSVHSLYEGTVPVYMGEQYPTSEEDPRNFLNQSMDGLVYGNLNHQAYDEVKNYEQNVVYQNQIPFHLYYQNPQLIPLMIPKQVIPTAHQVSPEEILLLSQNSQVATPETSQPFVGESSSQDLSVQPPELLHQLKHSQRPLVQYPVESLNVESQGLQFVRPELSEMPSAFCSSQMQHPFVLQSQTVPQKNVSPTQTMQQIPLTKSHSQTIERDYLQSHIHPSSILQHQLQPSVQSAPFQIVSSQNCRQTVLGTPVSPQNSGQTVSGTPVVPQNFGPVSGTHVSPQNSGQTVSGAPVLHQNFGPVSGTPISPQNSGPAVSGTSVFRQNFGPVSGTPVPSFTQTHPPEFLQPQIYSASLLEQQMLQQQFLTYQNMPQFSTVPIHNNLAEPSHQSVSKTFMENSNGTSCNNYDVDLNVVQQLKSMMISEKTTENCYKDSLSVGNNSDLSNNFLQGSISSNRSELFNENSVVNQGNHQSIPPVQINNVNQVNVGSKIVNGNRCQGDSHFIRDLKVTSHLQPSLFNDHLSAYSGDKRDNNNNTSLGLQNCSPHQQEIPVYHRDSVLQSRSLNATNASSISSNYSQLQFGIGHSKFIPGQVTMNGDMPKPFHSVLSQQQRKIRDEFLQNGIISRGRGRLNL